jgi:subfamily B ATP-binding cassette protein MsbA
MPRAWRSSDRPVAKETKRSVFFFAKENRAVFTWLHRAYVRPYFWHLVAATFFMILTAASAAALAWLAQPAVDDVFGDGDRSMATIIPLAVLGVVTVNGVSIYFQQIIVSYVGQNIVAKLQLDLFQHFNGADAAVRSKQHNAWLLARLMNDTGAVQGLVSGTVIGLARDVLMFVFLTGVMAYRDWPLAIITLMILPLLGIGIGSIGLRTRKLTEQVMDKSYALSTAVTEALDGQRLVKIYGTEEIERQRVGGAIQDRLKVQRRLIRSRALTSPLTEILGGVAIAAAMFYGAQRAQTSGLTFGELGSFLAALILAYRPLKRLAATNVSVQGGLIAGRRVIEAFSLKAEVIDAPDARPLRIGGGEIRFEGVGFHYEPGRPVLQGVDLAVPAGRAIAIVGVSGGGKSTLLNLIPRLYDVTEGRILIDGQDIRGVTLDSLRAVIGVVTQETILFDDTVKANIAYGRPGASDAEIEAAARAAAALDFIQELPEGMGTKIGQRGVRLSGGQRQRIAIARAMLRDSPILLLDEATSSLDNEAEQQVKVALQRLMKGRTTLIVAHRLTTVIDADEIHVMEAGRIVESGTHASLLRLGGRYARLYQTQQTASDAA